MLGEEILREGVSALSNTRGRSNVGGCKVRACVRNQAPFMRRWRLALSVACRRLQLQCWPASGFTREIGAHGRTISDRWGAGRDRGPVPCGSHLSGDGLSSPEPTRRSAALKQSQTVTISHVAGLLQRK